MYSQTESGRFASCQDKSTETHGRHFSRFRATSIAHVKIRAKFSLAITINSICTLGGATVVTLLRMFCYFVPVATTTSGVRRHVDDACFATLGPHGGYAGCGLDGSWPQSYGDFNITTSVEIELLHVATSIYQWPYLAAGRIKSTSFTRGRSELFLASYPAHQARSMRANGLPAGSRSSSVRMVLGWSRRAQRQLQPPRLSHHRFICAWIGSIIIYR